MGGFHVVRVGALAHVGRFRSADAATYPRGARVVLRTGRGLELGEVLVSGISDLSGGGLDPAGTILRRMTVEDQLLEARLEKNRQAAFAACARRIEQLALPVALLEVEQLFDGRTLVFHFLGEEPPELASLVDELAELYDAKAQISAFADLLLSGCGPGCGTEDATGPGCGGCATGCAAAAVCSTRRR